MAGIHNLNQTQSNLPADFEQLTIGQPREVTMLNQQINPTETKRELVQEIKNSSNSRTNVDIQNQQAHQQRQTIPNTIQINPQPHLTPYQQQSCNNLVGVLDLKNTLDFNNPNANTSKHYHNITCKRLTQPGQNNVYKPHAKFLTQPKATALGFLNRCACNHQNHNHSDQQQLQKHLQEHLQQQKQRRNTRSTQNRRKNEACSTQ